MDAWPVPPIYHRPGMTPRVVIVDLQGLPDPRTVLQELQSVVPSDRVLVITALGTVTVDEIRRIGYQVVTRPTSIRDVVAATAKLLGANGAFSAGRGQE
jgi:tRNA(Ser,Leu) C12 N-acetylase TAN1